MPAAARRHRPSAERKAVAAPIPRAWPNSTIVLIAGGPSLSRGQITSVYHAWAEGRVRVLGCNDAYRLAPWMDGLYGADLRWWEHHIDAVRLTHMALLWSQHYEACQRYGLWHTPGEYVPGISLDPARIHLGQGAAHSGYQLLNIAVHMGAKRILLLGYDCRLAAGRRHWFGDHPAQMTGHMDWSRAPGVYAAAAPQLAELGIDVINCTPESAIACFPRGRVGTLLA